jgi:hypothetical protein
VIEHENASGEFSPSPPPVSKAIGIPARFTGVNMTVPTGITLPPILIEVAVIVVICAEARDVMPITHRSVTAALNSRFIGAPN